jgi:adenine deaminase
MVLTHPEDIVEASMNDVKGIAAMGAFVEHSLCMFLEGSKFKIAGAEDLRRHIEAAGVDQTVFCSDLGQTGNMTPLEGFRAGVRLCIDLGYDDEQIRKMVSLNTARMLGIEADLPAMH